MKHELTIDENHRYWLNGENIPGTNEVISSVFPYEGKTDEYYSLKGRAIHEAIRLEIEGKLDYKSLTPLVKDYLEQAMMAVEKLGILTVRCKTEVMLYSKKLNTAGTLDLDDGEFIDDWKSGMKSITHRIGIAHYRHLHNINNPKDKRKQGRIIYLDGSKNMPEIVYEQSSDIGVFLDCLNIFNYREVNKC